MNESLDYGPVLITKGKYKGCIGYFDNESDYPSKGVVYLNTPFLTDYVLIPYKNMVKSEKKHIPSENLRSIMPEKCAMLGMR